MDQERTIEFTIEEDMDGIRIDRVLAFLMEDQSRSYLQKLIGTGHLHCNGVAVTAKNQKVCSGDHLTLHLPAPEALQVVAEDIPLEIVFEDEDLLVVNKPRGMVVHPAPGNPTGTLVSALLYHCGGNLSSINGVLRPGIVHRIDKDTSGLLLVAKNDHTHRHLAKQLEEHSIHRLYEALVYNNFSEEEGTIDQPIGRDPKNRLRQAVVPGGRRAVTHYRVLERFGRYSRIQARLETGRTHQIRVHMKHIGHPLIGDGLYGPAKNPFGVQGQLLHAGTLGFIHPKGETMEFHCPPPAIYQQVLSKL